jgi:TPP-dependent pyruvate/acetoin dehydrogenase alpha subunit
MATADQLDRVVEQVGAEIGQALEGATQSPLPALEEVTRDVYA